MTTKLQEMLQEERRRLEGEIKQLEDKIRPLQQELEQRRVQQSHILGLLDNKGDGPEPQGPSGFKPGPSGADWAELCRKHGWRIGTDSAHRVVLRQDPRLHASIPHKCPYDGKTYP